MLDEREDYFFRYRYAFGSLRFPTGAYHRTIASQQWCERLQIDGWAINCSVFWNYRKGIRFMLRADAAFAQVA